MRYCALLIVDQVKLTGEDIFVAPFAGLVKLIGPRRSAVTFRLRLLFFVPVVLDAAKLSV